MFNLIEAANAAKGGFDWSMIIMLVAMFAIVYFFMIRPQKKRQKEIENFRKNLTIEISKGVTIQIDRNYVYAEGNMQQQGQ